MLSLAKINNEWKNEIWEKKKYFPINRSLIVWGMIADTTSEDKKATGMILMYVIRTMKHRGRHVMCGKTFEKKVSIR